LRGCSAHGWRHAAGRRPAEAGCSEHDIAAMLGMSLRMVVRYTAAASQELLADSRIAASAGIYRSESLSSMPILLDKTAAK
jgi:hypothetical protein